MIEVAGLKGEFEVFLYDEKKALKAYRHVKNLTVTAGFQSVCDDMGKVGAQPAAFGWCGIGTGTVAPVIGDTLLATETARAAGGYTRTADTIWQNAATFGAGTGTGAITESGLFNVVTANTPTMLCRQTFAVINKGANDTLVVTWQYTLS